MSDDIDYRSIDIPADKSPEDMTYVERRALLLEHIRDKGSPARISRTGMAQRFDVDASQISRDIDTLASYVAEDLDSDRVTLQTWAVVEKTIDGLLEAGEEDWRAYREAFDVACEWQELVASTQPPSADHINGVHHPPNLDNVKSKIAEAEAREAAQDEDFDEEEAVETLNDMADQAADQISDTLVE